jgi:hypothetical protein
MHRYRTSGLELCHSLQRLGIDPASEVTGHIPYASLVKTLKTPTEASRRRGFSFHAAPRGRSCDGVAAGMTGAHSANIRKELAGVEESGARSQASE